MKKSEIEVGQYVADVQLGTKYKWIAGQSGICSTCNFVDVYLLKDISLSKVSGYPIYYCTQCAGIESLTVLLETV